MLLSRDTFRIEVLKRDNHKCIICNNTATDAHHILERRLFPDGGYYIDNGASVCAICHIECERTNISVEEVRNRAKITRKIIPPHLYDDQEYDKWGNIILQNGTRLKGELFYDYSVQKILSDKLNLFVEWVKYPRTYHLPWSLGMNDDDRMHEDISIFNNQLVTVTEKMDGENTSLYSNYIHARSVDSRSHPTRDWVKNFWSKIKHEIPSGWRICGENLRAEHSIKYRELSTFFMGFSIWDNNNNCLSVHDTLDWFGLLDIKHVPILYHGIYDETKIKEFNNRDPNKYEGYVVRLSRLFNYSEFSKVVAKFVRKDHIQTSKHWMLGEYTFNTLK